jgi:hypothetical protein
MSNPRLHCPREDVSNPHAVMTRIMTRMSSAKIFTRIRVKFFYRRIENRLLILRMSTSRYTMCAILCTVKVRMCDTCLTRRPCKICVLSHVPVCTLSQSGRRREGLLFFLLAYKFRIFNADDEIRFNVLIRWYRIVMRISYLSIFTSTELEFLKIIYYLLYYSSNYSKMTDKIEYCRSCTYRICHLSSDTI